MTFTAAESAPLRHGVRTRAAPVAHRRRPGDDLVPRPELVRRLVAARDVPVVLVVAPAGYGKTILLSQWASADSRRFARVRVRAADNDPPELVRSIAQALRRAGSIDEDELVKLSGGRPKRPERAAAALAAALAGAGRAAVLALDGLEVIRAREAMALLSELIERLEPGTQLVIASRTEPQLRLGGVRAQRKLVELRAGDLAMGVSQAAALVSLHGLALDRAGLELLVRRTEGWPAGLYLATLAAREELHPGRALAGFGGDDRFVADYIGDELLAPLGQQEVAFLARTSVLGSLSGPLCDYVLERADSARILKRMSRMNLMLVPLDRSDDEYRYHRLFAQTLRAELRHSEPGTEAGLHRRASVWYREHGDIERSIEHAVEAGDMGRAGELIWSRAASALGFGQVAQLERWLGAFSDAQLADSQPLALAAAAHGLVGGDRNLVEHWTSAAMRAAGADGSAALAAEGALLRAMVAEDRVDRMGELAAAACAELPDDSPWQGLGCLEQGVARHLSGEREAARGLLEEGARRSAATSPNIQALCLAQLTLLAIERRDSAVAESLAARAKAQVERSGTSGYATSALVYALSSDVEGRLGRVEASQAAAREAMRLLSELTDFSPWYEAECRIALARAALRLGDARLARDLLSEAARQLERSADAKVALAWIDDCQAQAELSSASTGGREWALTTAELRVLQFLPTHLSFPDIAERLYVSANTVKTHARSVYRKLDASSRGEAVARARHAGLLDQASHAGVGRPEPAYLS